MNFFVNLVSPATKSEDVSGRNVRGFGRMFNCSRVGNWSVFELRCKRPFLMWKIEKNMVIRVFYWIKIIAVLPKPILCTKNPNFTMLFYYIKTWTSSSPYHPFLQLNRALKWGTVWTSISIGIETRMDQI